MAIQNFYKGLFGLNINFKKGYNIHFNRIYFDLNQIVHSNASKSIHTKQWIQNIIFELKSILLKFSDKELKSIHIYLDGIAPRSKLITQRKRRQIHEWDPFLNKKKSLIDNRMITPGTDLMNELNSNLKNFIFELKKLYPKQQIHFSNTNVFGEGEYKIFHHIKYHTIKNEFILVIGGDSDLFLYSLSSKNKNIYIYKDKKILILPDLGISKSDFIIMNLFKGNDFIPSIHGYDIHNFFKLYLKKKEPLLIEDDEKYIFNLNLFKEIKNYNVHYEQQKSYKSILYSIQFILFKENVIYKKEDEIYYVYIKDILLGSSESEEKAAENAINNLMNNDIYLKNIPISKEILMNMIQYFSSEEEYIQEDNIDKIIQEYFIGVLWILNYFQINIQDYGYFYPYKPLHINLLKNKNQIIIHKKDIPNYLYPIDISPQLYSLFLLKINKIEFKELLDKEFHLFQSNSKLPWLKNDLFIKMKQYDIPFEKEYEIII